MPVPKVLGAVGTQPAMGMLSGQFTSKVFCHHPGHELVPHNPLGLPQKRQGQGGAKAKVGWLPA